MNNRVHILVKDNSNKAHLTDEGLYIYKGELGMKDKQQKPIWIQNISQLVTLASDKKGPRVREEMRELAIIEGGSVWLEDGVIQDLGTTREMILKYLPRAEEAEIVDATGKIVTPGLIDPHTHVVFGGSREHEFEMRLEGASYMDIMNAGGGIHATTRKMRSLTEEHIFNQTTRRLDLFLQHGVTTLESKSGYGLDLENELKQLRVMQRLQNKHPMDIVPTFMGAHAVPEEYRENPEHFVNLVIDEMIPAVVEEKLAKFIDVFCEVDVFTPEQAERILLAGKAQGLIPKIHADEIEENQGAHVAARVGAISAEHLLKVSDEGIEELAKSGVIACLLPATALYLGEKPARARDIIDAGVAVAISTDCNPGSSPTISLPLVMNLACITMKMTPAESLCAATYNAACALQIEDRVGSIEIGKQADLVLWDVHNHQKLHYIFGVNHVKKVWKKGVKVVG